MRGERRAVTLPASMGLLGRRMKCVSFGQPERGARVL